MMLVDWI
jgi:Ca2+-binding EF-hand superfamily protein